MHKSIDADALVIGAGPAGASTAILLRLAGWRVILVEQQVYPRQKVCGECLSASSLALLDRLGVGGAVRDRAGPELTQLGWMSGVSTLIAPLPPCREGPYRYGRALGRDQLDAILVNRARELDVTLIQPAKVRSVSGVSGNFDCEIQVRAAQHAQRGRSGESITHHVPIVIDAHGSWENGPLDGPRLGTHVPRRGSDLFGFKASFVHATLAHGLLPVLSFPGGYGGLVIADGGRLTLAGCIRRDTLASWRAQLPGASAGAAFEAYLRTSCRGVREMLEVAQRSEPWQSVGPLRPRVRVGRAYRMFSVGNAAGESHPLIGEGMNMALQSAFMLASHLTEQPTRAINVNRALEIHRTYGAQWRSAFEPRLRLAAILAHIAMRPALSRPVTRLLRTWPQLLTAAAQLAGKARSPVGQSFLLEGAP
jgi:2-polyprenyl-6-methoxyphenol hydroxylase-like FAD-dependent oxidoreductase